ncbi:MAG: aminotransferase class I/II-fold pyridoxal phosphate-dependent enzyme, partial [Bacteroidota bacterium]
MNRMEEILDQLKTWEPIARQLSPDPLTREIWNRQVFNYADQFIDDLPDLPAYVADQEGLKALDELKIGEDGKDMLSLLRILEKSVDRSGINPASGGHIGYIPGGGLYPTALGDYLAAVFNRYAGIYFGSPGAVKMENDLIQWMVDLVGYPKGSAGNLASGGSIANLIAITSARESMQIKSSQVPECVIYLTEQVHHCVQKALRIAGMGESILRYIPMRDDFSMDPQYLERQVAVDRQQGLFPFMLIASVGTTDTGAVDPLESLADIAEKNELWMHVDAAYGGFFILVEEMQEHFRGIERSHSVAIDPHKGLFLSYGLG